MADNLYAPPRSEVADTDRPATRNTFYIVSIRKLAILYFSTLGIYSLYWFYRNWKCFRDATQTSLWPIVRTLFLYFFVHSLFREVLDHARKQNIPLHWKSGWHATLLVTLLLVSNILDRISAKGIGSPVTDILSWLLLLPLGALFIQAQKHINTACGDDAGSCNAELTSANYIWILIGLLIWALSIFGIVAR